MLIEDVNMAAEKVETVSKKRGKPKTQSKRTSDSSGNTKDGLPVKIPRKRGPKKKEMTAERREKMKVRRVNANTRERKRMHGLNDALDTLREHVPCYSQSQKFSKIETLRLAANYIQILSSILESGEKPNSVEFARSLAKGMSQNTVNLIASSLSINPRLIAPEQTTLFSPGPLAPPGAYAAHGAGGLMALAPSGAYNFDPYMHEFADTDGIMYSSAGGLAEDIADSDSYTSYSPMSSYEGSPPKRPSTADYMTDFTQNAYATVRGMTVGAPTGDGVSSQNMTYPQQYGFASQTVPSLPVDILPQNSSPYASSASRAMPQYPYQQYPYQNQPASAKELDFGQASHLGSSSSNLLTVDTKVQGANFYQQAQVRQVGY